MTTELRTVKTLKSMLCDNGVIPMGTIGTIVDIHKDGKTLEVEFTGKYQSVLTLEYGYDVVDGRVDFIYNGPTLEQITDAFNEYLDKAPYLALDRKEIQNVLDTDLNLYDLNTLRQEEFDKLLDREQDSKKIEVLKLLKHFSYRYLLSTSRITASWS